MKKLGIITLNGYFNYGNRLQNYALQEVLKSFDYEVETIWIENKKKNNKSSSNKMVNVLRNPKIIFKKIYNMLYLDSLNSKRVNRFKDFSRTYINETSTKISEDYLPESLLEDYQYFITGSDQVWNPYYTRASPLYFLTFAPKEKRIAYAPSFGISELPDFCVEQYKEWLSEMNCISVREDAGAKIISDLTGRTAKVVADPTLLLTKDSWLTITKSAVNKPDNDYLLTYFLGKVPKDIDKRIKSYARKHNLKVVNLAQPKVKEYYLTDPSEFLDYINSAKVFFTDSFHGAVFSILFETPFVVTDRLSKTPSMNSRITTLLSKFNLEERHISNLNEKDILNINFSHVEPLLEQERSKGITYLEKSLN